MSRSAARPGQTPCVLIAHPSSDVYGADLQLLETVTGLADAGWRVHIVMPGPGSLDRLLEKRGVTPDFMTFPVLRRSALSARGLARLSAQTIPATVRMHKLIRKLNPDVVYVNTVTIPWWLLAARTAGVGSVCHIHEAEDSDRRPLLLALNGPLTLSHRIVANSRASMEAIVVPAPWLRRKLRLVYNGVEPPAIEPDLPPDGQPSFRLAIVGRLSPRKAQDVALEAVAALRARGHDVSIDVCGTAFHGYEWYAEQLQARAQQPDLLGAVRWRGYVSPVWPVLASVDAIVAPSLREPFGNAVVEAQLARRPVVASAALGHNETIQHGVTGLLVTPGDPTEMADSIERLITDRALAESIAEAGLKSARADFSVDRYRADIVGVVADVARRQRPAAKI
ncbi:MAG: glycosyltransferase family 4 protein [Mycobacteriales bacterium]